MVKCQIATRTQLLTKSNLHQQQRFRNFQCTTSKTMAKIDSNLYLYKIPTREIIENRREFYRLKRENDEQPVAWLDRVQYHIICCAFPKIVEYFLIDKCLCALNTNELESVRRVAVNTWSFDQLHEYFDDWKIGADQPNNGNILVDSVTIKCEFVSNQMQQTIESSLS